MSHRGRGRAHHSGDLPQQFSHMSMQSGGRGGGRGGRGGGGRGDGFGRGGGRGDGFGRGGGRGDGFGRGGGRGSGFREPHLGPGGDFNKFPDSESYKIVQKSPVEPGTSGRKVDLLANFFRINVGSIIVYQYDLDFTFKNDEDKKRYDDNEKVQKFFAKFNPELFSVYLRQNPEEFKKLNYIYDGGRNLYTTKEFNNLQNFKVIEHTCGIRRIEFLFKMKMVQKIDLSLIADYFKNTNVIPEVGIHFVELLLQNIYTKKYSLFNHKFFDADKPFGGPNNWLKFAYGFSDAIRLTEIGTTLNLHMKTGLVISPSAETLSQLASLISRSNDLTKITQGDISRVNKIIKGLKVYTTHGGQNRTYSVKGLLKKTPKEISFTKGSQESNEEQITVADYFKSQYNISLKNYPVVQVIGKRDMYIPLELCKLVQKQFLNNSKVDDDIQSEMLRVSTHKPLFLFNRLTDYAAEMDSLNPSLFGEYKMSLIPKPVRFSGRILDNPKQLCSNRGDKFYQTIPVIWAFFSFDPKFTTEDMNYFRKDIEKISRRYQMDMSAFKTAQMVGQYPNLETICNLFGNAKINKCNLVFVALETNNKLYNIIKHVGDQRLGIVTQCVNTAKAKSRKGGYIDNILLKVNGKLGGKNSIIEKVQWDSLPITAAKTMFIGIDVNHPGQMEKVESSIAAAVGSYDSSFTVYNASIRVQKKNRQEIIDCLGEMITELLEEYRKVNNYYPEVLFVFRDGVSEAQLVHAEEEIRQIRSAYRKCIKNGKVVFIVVQKRHQTRFVLVNPMGPSGRESHNVPSGTIVDNTIVEPSHHMFYLNSHYSPLGTSKPSKYIVLHNDFERRQLNNDHLQKICFYACHNCTRYRGGAISIPIPIRYADLCAYRSKLHLESQYQQHFRLSCESAEEFEKKFIEKLNQIVKINNSMKQLLYYC